MNKNKITDTSINDFKDDKLKFTESIVPRVLNIITDEYYFPLTVAITGGWGAGKTSVITLVKNKLKEESKNVIISFDPLIEGKQTLNELIELFYLKIIQQIDNKEIKGFFKKLLKSLVTITRVKASLNYSDSMQSVTVGLEKDLGADIEKLTEIWERDEPKLLSQHAEEINSLLSKKGIKLYVFIDEIDRLSSDQIIPLLLFSRTMESIDHLVCVLGLDYNRTIRKLIIENKLGGSNYSDIKFYLDKLITLSFHVDTTLDNRVELLSELLIRHGICDAGFIKINVRQLREICDYLATPRGIKKIIILAYANKEIFKNSVNQILFLKLLAIEVMNPIIKEYLAKHENILHSNNILHEPDLLPFLEYDSQEKERSVEDVLDLNESIKKLLLGILDPHLNNNSFLGLKGQIPYFITDYFNSTYMTHILEGIPRSLLHAYIRNFDQPEFKIFFDFFQGDISSALADLAKLPHQSIADDISGALRKNIPIENELHNINPEILNQLWLKDVDYLAGSPYTHISNYLAPFIPLEITL